MSTARDVRRWLDSKGYGDDYRRGGLSDAVVRAFNEAHPEDPYRVPNPFSGRTRAELIERARMGGNAKAASRKR